MEDFEKKEEQIIPVAGIKNPFILAATSGNNSVAKWVGGTLLILGGWFVGSAIFIMVFNALKTALGNRILPFEKNLYFALIILGFASGVATIWLVIRNFHGRTFRSLITPYAKINWKKIIIAFCVYFSLTSLIEGTFYYVYPENYVLQLDWAKFIPLLLICFLLAPFQTSFEELFFRGYLMQGFGLLFKRTLPPLLITSVLFALAHGGNPENTTYGYGVMFVFYFSFALMLGFITLFDKTLEIALATHAANNIFTALFFTFEASALQTDAVFIQKNMDPLATMPYYFASMFVFLLICSFVFGWWKRKQNVQASQ